MPDRLESGITLLLLVTVGVSVADGYEPAVILTGTVLVMWVGVLVTSWRERRR